MCFCFCVFVCTGVECVCGGSSFLSMGTIAVGVNGWMEEKEKKPFSEQEKAFS